MIIEIISISTDGNQLYIIDVNHLSDDGDQGDFKKSIFEVIMQLNSNDYRKKNVFGNFLVVNGEIIQSGYICDQFLWEMNQPEEIPTLTISVFNHE